MQYYAAIKGVLDKAQVHEFTEGLEGLSLTSSGDGEGNKAATSE